MIGNDDSVYTGPIFTIEPTTDDNGNHVWNLTRLNGHNLFQLAFKEASVARGASIKKVDGVYFFNDFGLIMNLDESMFADERHILRVSYDLDFLDPRDILNMQVTSESATETIVVHKKLYCSCDELNDVDLILPQHFLNLN